MLCNVGVSPPILQRGNLSCCPLWVWAHPYCSEKTFHAVHCGCEPTHTVQRGNLLCCPLWVSAHPYCLERKPVLSIVGVSTPMLFRDKTFCAVNCGCEHTHTVQRGNLCCLLWVSAHPYCSERKPSVLSIVGVSTPILFRDKTTLFREKTFCAVHCEHPPTLLERKPYTPCAFTDCHLPVMIWQINTQ